MHGKKVEINGDELSPEEARRLEEFRAVIEVQYSPYWSRPFLCRAIGAGMKVVNLQQRMESTDVAFFGTTHTEALKGLLAQNLQIN